MTKCSMLALAVLISFWACNKSDHELTKNRIEAVEHLFDLSFDPTERDSMVDGVLKNIKSLNEIHNYPVDNSIRPALVYDPRPEGFEFNQHREPKWGLPSTVKLPQAKEDIAFLTVAELSVLIRQRKISSLELTKIYLNRLKKYGDTLHSVITITEELAIQQAKRADRQITNGNYKGPLHGIPYGVKDLLAVPGYKTTWGANPYKDQVIDETATVVKKLEDAGAVLVAKLTLGALAWGDVWYGGVTRNPWNLEQGSSGSSAGSASSTAAGLVPFAIGTETWGSIISPSTRCGTTGLRPTFGRVSRYGAMALNWSLDKIGPICRSALDCALVFEVIRGEDGKDPSVVNAPFNYKPVKDLRNMKIGYIKELFDKKYPDKSQIDPEIATKDMSDYPHYKNNLRTLEVLRSLGANLEPISLSDNIPVDAIGGIINAVESAAAFDELTRSNRDKSLTRQIKNSYPNVFRVARIIPAVEYLQANRIRRDLSHALYSRLKEYDVIITPTFGANLVLMTNLTGHPVVVLPNGFNSEGNPTSITFLGNLYEEAIILAVANLYQENTDFNKQHPGLFLKSE